MPPTSAHNSAPTAGMEHPTKVSGTHQKCTSDLRKVKLGRKTLLLDTEKIDRLCDALLAANSVRNACALACIGEATFHRWMHDADSAPEGAALREFRERVKRARAEAEHRNVMVIQRAARKNWTAAAWYLERSNPREWGRKRFVTSKGETTAPPLPAARVAEGPLTDDEALASLEAILEREREGRLPVGSQSLQPTEKKIVSFETVANAA